MSGTITDGAGYDLAKTLAEREDMNAICNMAREIREGRLVQTTHVGDRVAWDSRYGGVAYGTVTKVNQRTAKVMADGGVPWRVSLSLLRKA